MRGWHRARGKDIDGVETLPTTLPAAPSAPGRTRPVRETWRVSSRFHGPPSLPPWPPEPGATLLTFPPSPSHRHGIPRRHDFLCPRRRSSRFRGRALLSPRCLDVPLFFLSPPTQPRTEILPRDKVTVISAGLAHAGTNTSDTTCHYWPLSAMTRLLFRNSTFGDYRHHHYFLCSLFFGAIVNFAIYLLSSAPFRSKIKLYLIINGRIINVFRFVDMRRIHKLS